MCDDINDNVGTLNTLSTASAFHSFGMHSIFCFYNIHMHAMHFNITYAPKIKKPIMYKLNKCKHICVPILALFDSDSDVLWRLTILFLRTIAFLPSLFLVIQSHSMCYLLIINRKVRFEIFSLMCMVCVYVYCLLKFPTIFINDNKFAIIIYNYFHVRGFCTFPFSHSHQIVLWILCVVGKFMWLELDLGIGTFGVII